MMAAAHVLAPKGAHILVVDDDQRIRTLLSRFLINEGYLVSAASSAQEARARLDDLAFDLIVLDVMMPGETGLEFAARLRAGEEPLRSAPILMLTALSETTHRVEGLEAGVDDYLAKPFDPRELSLRIASILRRAQKGPPKRPDIRFGEFLFDVARGELTRAGAPVRLTTREQELLGALAAHPGKTLSRRQLTWREGPILAGERSVDVEIVRLRRKIETNPNAPRYLLTVRGKGYRLLADAPVDG